MYLYFRGDTDVFVHLREMGRYVKYLYYSGGGEGGRVFT
jgi:hypothetical protein